MIKNKVCPECGHENDDDARFCNECGSPVEESASDSHTAITEELPSSSELIDQTDAPNKPTGTNWSMGHNKYR